MQSARILPPNLDDRTWEDIVDEAKTLIPKFCPEWTDHNTSDPGITLIELFAWIAEGVTYRLNQVPEKNYIAFLNLLGITRDPPSPAKVELEFIGSAPVLIPKGIQVSTVQKEQEDAVVFETDKDLQLTQADVPGIVSATNALTIREPEILGESTGEAFQVFKLRFAPLYKDPDGIDPFDHLEIQVDDETWQKVDEFSASDVTQYRCNPVTGEINFGNFPTGDPDNPGFGRIPSANAQIKATHYRHVVGGIRSNVPANTVVLLKTPRAGVSEVANPAPAKGGSEMEPIEETLRRAPLAVKSRERAVTNEDYEFLAREATTEVAKVRCLAPRKKPDNTFVTTPFDRSPGKVNLLFIPNEDPGNPRQPQPSPDLIDEVMLYLDSRRVLTGELLINAPIYAEIAVEATAFVQRGQNQQKAEEAIKDELESFLHPVSGGPDRSGWEIGQDLYIPQVFDAIRNLPEVSFVDQLKVSKNDQPAEEGVRIANDEHELVSSAERGKFQITIEEEEEEL